MTTTSATAAARARPTRSTSGRNGVRRAWIDGTSSTATCCSSCRTTLDLSTSFRALSGRPIDATLGTDTGVGNGDRINTDRPYSAPGVSFERNAFRNESIKDVNLRAQWKFDFNGTKRVIFTFEAFNLFNWDNIELSGTPVTNYCAAPIASDCGFGAPTNPNFLSLTDENPTSTRRGQLLLNNIPGAPRQIQLGLRFQF